MAGVRVSQIPQEHRHSGQATSPILLPLATSSPVRWELHYYMLLIQQCAYFGS